MLEARKRQISQANMPIHIKVFLEQAYQNAICADWFWAQTNYNNTTGGWTKATKFIGKYVDPYQRISWTGISKSHMCRLIWAQSNYWNTTRQLKVSGETLNFLWYATEIGHVCVLPFLELCKCYSINNNSCVCRFKYILQGFWLVAIDDLSATKTWC